MAKFNNTNSKRVLNNHSQQFQGKSGQLYRARLGAWMLVFITDLTAIREEHGPVGDGPRLPESI
jgi:hypothetical protein